MAAKGLTEHEIMQAAVRLVEEGGYESFSLRELAARLGVKPASLYNHVRGLEQINISVAMQAAKRLEASLTQAIADKPRDAAFLDACRAYRAFAAENPELYKALLRMPLSDDEKVVQAAMASFAPLRQLIEGYGAPPAQTVHFSRALRAMMHGFVDLSASGFLRRSEIGRDESYEAILAQYLQILKGLGDGT